MQRRFLVLAISLFFSSLLAVVPARAAVPTGFSSTQYATIPFLSTSMAFAPDGRMFLLSKDGNVWTLKDGVLSSKPVLTLKVSQEKERGLLGIAFDDQFSGNKTLYLVYTTGKGSLRYGGSPKNRVSRFTMSADGMTIDSTTEKILLDNLPSDAGFHNGGAIHSGPDHRLYISTGDGGKNPDNAQDLNSLAGKVLRINPDGSVPADNPFVGQQNKRGEIWAYGFRNPWRFTFDSKTGKMIVADVGAGKFEEINVVARGANYGWPDVEGPEPKNVKGVTYPIYAYPHIAKTSSAVIGGVVYYGDAFPAAYQGKYFFGDFGQGFLRSLILSGSDSGKATDFDTGVGWMTDMVQGPDDALYYFVATGPTDGHVQKVSYTQQVTVQSVITASTGAGPLPLKVSFSAAQSNPQLPHTTYVWDFGDGARGLGVKATHTFTTKSTFKVRLTATTGQGVASSATAAVVAGDTPPVPVITLPKDGTTYKAGDTIHYAGTATDSDDGTLSASAMQWTVVFHHLDHFHPYLGPVKNTASGLFTIGRDGETSPVTWYEIKLTVTDADGVRVSTSRTMYPREVTLKLASNISAAPLELDESPTPSAVPYSFKAVENFPRTISAPASFKKNGRTFSFVRWSDGGARIHQVVPGTKNVTYTATYR